VTGQLHDTAALPPGKDTICIRWIRMLGGSQKWSGWRGEEKNPFPYQNSNSDPSVVQPVGCHCVGCDITAMEKRRFVQLSGIEQWYPNCCAQVLLTVLSCSGSLLKDPAVIYLKVHSWCRSQWPRGLGHEMSSLARTLGSWVRIPLKAWMSLFSLCLC
jgi:hypothetical protein